MFAENKDPEEIYKEIYKSSNGDITKATDTIASICGTATDLALKVDTIEGLEKSECLQLFKRYTKFVNWFDEEKLGTLIY